MEFVNKKQWINYSNEDVEKLIDMVFYHYRHVGFPYFPTSLEYRASELRKVEKYNGEVIKNGIIKQTMHGLGFLWSFHPNSFAVKCNNKMSPLEAFNDDDIFRRVIAKRIKIGDTLTPNGIRKMLKMFSGVQGVSNFRPTAAKAIYQHLLPDGGVTWDMSSGWGGRLLGAHLAGVKYIGTDPAVDTQENNRCIAKFLGSDSLLITDGSECRSFNNVDLCFTSPPYFDCEKYSSDEGQSYIKYKTRSEWVDGFLSSTLHNCWSSLNSNGLLAMNVANVPSFNNLESIVLETAKKTGFRYDYTLNLALSSSIGKSGFKYEPLFVFKKK